MLVLFVVGSVGVVSCKRVNLQGQMVGYATAAGRYSLFYSKRWEWVSQRMSGQLNLDRRRRRRDPQLLLSLPLLGIGLLVRPDMKLPSVVSSNRHAPTLIVSKHLQGEGKKYHSAYLSINDGWLMLVEELDTSL